MLRGYLSPALYFHIEMLSFLFMHILGQIYTMDLDTLFHLQTEASNPQTRHIDQLSTLDMCKLINTEDHRVAASLTPCLPQIAGAIDTLTPRVRRGGRVIYVGAGTSGRSVNHSITCRDSNNIIPACKQTRHPRRIRNPTDIRRSTRTIHRSNRRRRRRDPSGPRRCRG